MIKGAIISKTRMVQLPATAATEIYVAACWVPGAGGIFVGGMRTKTKTRTITKTVRGACARSPQVPPNAYTHRLGFLCLA